MPHTNPVTPEWLEAFASSYRALAEVGKADAFGGAESMRVLADALNSGLDAEALCSFIYVEANLRPPSLRQTVDRYFPKTSATHTKADAS